VNGGSFMADVLFNKNDYKILEILIERRCSAPAASLTIKQLSEVSGMSLSKVRTVVNNFLLMNFVQCGSKDGNNKTFLHTEEGVKHYKLVFGFDDEKINEMISNFENEYEEE
jgi:DNA-binding transcriptional regulator GbsR (MarR family)